MDESYPPAQLPGVPVIEAVGWGAEGSAVRYVDQRRLPAQWTERETRDLDEACEAIRTLAVRGAPAIGVFAALALVVCTPPLGAEPGRAYVARLRAHADRLRATRPTAVNLAWALDRMLLLVLDDAGDPFVLHASLRALADGILADDRAMCRAIGGHGAPLVADGARVLTHCNAGALATSGMGTALAPVYLAAQQGRRVSVWADETRPLLQGARLTAWELQRAGIPVTVLTDGMAASLMRAGQVDLVLVGADRIAANGDVANKIGTYGVAVAAHHHGIPFYVCAPASTIDPATPDGAAIVIEQRDRDEVARWGGVTTVPDGVPVHNPAFDVTPAALVTAIITDTGVHRPPYRFG